MNSLFKAGLEIQNYLNLKKWPFCFIGGLAVIRWGEVRMTQDIDLCILSGFGNEKKYIESLLGSFRSRIADAKEFAVTNRVLLLTASNDVPIDLTLSGLPFEKQMIDRATPFPYAPDCSLLTCSAEDLIVLKAFADRAQDWIDVRGIIVRQKGQLDIEYIFKHLTPLSELKESAEILDNLHNILK
ncbi:MAG: hypothetical protein U9Q38_06255 [Thermodesulfobacteriota bacterium]|nr:hypothetical protein [Thermodesulfobacteriota bacterium]